jgi:hypothetical protein
MTGGVELAAFSQELEAAVLAGDSAKLGELFFDPKMLEHCDLRRPKLDTNVPQSELAAQLEKHRAGLSAVRGAGPDANVLALVHKVRPRKRLLGAQPTGEDCPIDARGRVNIVVQPVTPPPDVVESHFEAVFAGGGWWILDYERAERDCSPLGAEETFGCRALQSGPAPD